MSSFGAWHWLAVLVIALLLWAFVAIFGRILNRTGYSRWWLLTIFVPLLNLIMLWVFAFANWPLYKPRVATPRCAQYRALGRSGSTLTTTSS